MIYHRSLGFSQKRGKTRQHKRSGVRSRGGVNLLFTGSSCLGWEHLLCVGGVPLFFQRSRLEVWPNPPSLYLLQCVQSPENAESRWLQPQSQKSLEGKAWHALNSHPKSMQEAALPVDTSGPLLLQWQWPWPSDRYKQSSAQVTHGRATAPCPHLLPWGAGRDTGIITPCRLW